MCDNARFHTYSLDCHTLPITPYKLYIPYRRYSVKRRKPQMIEAVCATK